MNQIKKLLFVFFIAAVQSCSEQDFQPIGFTSTKLQTLSISTGSLEPSFSPLTKEYEITSLNALNEISIVAKAFDQRASVFINGKLATNDHLSTRLNPDEDIFIEVKLNDSIDSYLIKYLPNYFPKFKVNILQKDSGGYIYFGQVDSGQPQSYIAMIDGEGSIVYYKKVNSQRVADFKKQTTVGGKVRYSYIQLEQNAFQPGFGFRGTAVVMDQDFNEINQIFGFTTSDGIEESTENHDFLLFEDNHYLISTYAIRKNVDLTSYGGINSAEVVDFIMQEVKNGTVLFEWNSKDFPEFLENSDDQFKSLYSSGSRIDYFHFNSFTIDPKDGNIILSARHMNQVYKINRNTGTIIWRLGGKNDDFNLTSDITFSHQHHVTILNNGNLMLFDNGNRSNPPRSRVMEFKLDELQLKAIPIWAYEEADRFSFFMGSAQRLENGNTLIGWGGGDPDKSDISEVTPEGIRVLDLSFVNAPTAQYTYRAFKF
jgi:hypothetical protein